jgi:hypothetical protein
MTDDPWNDLAPPTSAAAINARRVDANIPWGFFWARGIDRKCLLVLRHAAESTPTGRLPRLKGIEVVISEGDGDEGHMLVFRLLDSAQRDIFHRLCRDIVASAADAKSEKEAVTLALARTWRWHHLLRGGGDGRLSPEEQKGLIGELLVLERHILPAFAAFDAVSTWRGPLGAPKDFEVGRVCIEAKARRGNATPFVVISSEFQLDDGGADALYLHVAELDQAPADAEDTFTLSDVALRVRESIASADNRATDALETLLSAAGFSWDDDYSDSLWIVGATHLYRVSERFPRITAQEVATGVSNVKYSLSLVECEPFRVAEDDLQHALRGAGRGD